MPVIASAEPLTLSTKPMMLAEISPARGPSGARKPRKTGSRSRWMPRPFITANTNASSGTIASIVV
jgi:hypothetical protein